MMYWLLLLAFFTAVRGDCTFTAATSSKVIIDLNGRDATFARGDSQIPYLFIDSDDCLQVDDVGNTECTCNHEDGTPELTFEFQQSATIEHEMDVKNGREVVFTGLADISANIDVTATTLKIEKCITSLGEAQIWSADVQAVTISKSTLWGIDLTGRGTTTASTCTLTENMFLGAVNGYYGEHGFQMLNIQDFAQVTVNDFQCAGTTNARGDWPGMFTSPFIQSSSAVLLRDLGTVATMTVMLAGPDGADIIGTFEGLGGEDCPLDYLDLYAEQDVEITANNIDMRWVPCVNILGTGAVSISNVYLHAAYDDSSAYYPCEYINDGPTSITNVTSRTDYYDDTYVSRPTMQQKDFWVLDTRSNADPPPSLSLTNVSSPLWWFHYQDEWYTYLDLVWTNVIVGGFYPNITWEEDADHMLAYEASGYTSKIHGFPYFFWENVKISEGPLSVYSLPPRTTPDSENEAIDLRVDREEYKFIGTQWDSGMWFYIMGPVYWPEDVRHTYENFRDLRRVLLGYDEAECDTGSETTIYNSGVSGWSCENFIGSKLNLSMIRSEGSNIWGGESFSAFVKGVRTVEGELYVGTDDGNVESDAMWDPTTNHRYWAGASKDYPSNQFLPTPEKAAIENDKQHTQLPQETGFDNINMMSHLIAGQRLLSDNHRHVQLWGNGTINMAKSLSPIQTVETYYGKHTFTLRDTPEDSFQYIRPTLSNDRTLTFRGFDQVLVYSRSTYPSSGNLQGASDLFEDSKNGPVVMLLTSNMDEPGTAGYRTSSRDVDGTFRCNAEPHSHGDLVQFAKCFAYVIVPDVDLTVSTAGEADAISLDVEAFLFAALAPTSRFLDLKVVATHCDIYGGKYDNINIQYKTYYGFEEEFTDLEVIMHETVWSGELTITGDDVYNTASAIIDVDDNLYGFTGVCLESADSWGNKGMSTVSSCGLTTSRRHVKFIGQGDYRIESFTASTVTSESNTPSLVHVGSKKYVTPHPNIITIIPVKDRTTITAVLTGQTHSGAFDGSYERTLVSYERTLYAGNFTLDAKFGSCHLYVPEDWDISYIFDGQGQVFSAIERDMPAFDALSRKVYSWRLHAGLFNAEESVIYDFHSDRGTIFGSSHLGINPKLHTYEIRKEAAIVAASSNHENNPGLESMMKSQIDEKVLSSSSRSYVSRDYPNTWCTQPMCFANTAILTNCKEWPLYYFCTSTWTTPAYHDPEVEVPVSVLEIRGGFTNLWMPDFDGIMPVVPEEEEEPTPEPVTPTGLDAWVVPVVVVLGVAVVALAVFVVLAIFARPIFNKIFCCCAPKDDVSSVLTRPSFQ